MRAAYRLCDRMLLKRLPRTWDHRLRALMFAMARRLFPERIKARSVSEFSRTASLRKTGSARLPAWAESEVAALVELEPALSGLVAEDASLEPYVIPWDLNYVGRRYADARRGLAGNYTCMMLVGASGAIDLNALRTLAQPLAIVDVDGIAGLQQMAKAAGADYVVLHAEHLDMNDHSALLARLVLQLAPGQVGIARHPLLDYLVERHGLAMASVSKIERWDVPSAPLSGETSSGETSSEENSDH